MREQVDYVHNIINGAWALHQSVSKAIIQENPNALEPVLNLHSPQKLTQRKPRKKQKSRTQREEEAVATSNISSQGPNWGFLSRLRRTKKGVLRPTRRTNHRLSSKRRGYLHLERQQAEDPAHDLMRPIWGGAGFSSDNLQRRTNPCVSRWDR